jgi:hypothetical protein
MATVPRGASFGIIFLGTLLALAVRPLVNRLLLPR